MTARRILAVAALAALIGMTAACGRERAEQSQATTWDALVVYSDLPAAALQPLLDDFARGLPTNRPMKTKLVSGNAAALLDRLRQAPPQDGPDLLIFSDIAFTETARRDGLLYDAPDAQLYDLTPAIYRDPGGAWYGLALSPQRIYLNKELYDRLFGNEPPALGYADLAAARWRDRLCLRSTGSPYLTSLVAHMLARGEPAAAQAWVRDAASRLAQPPYESAHALLLDLAKGDCGIAVLNAPYYAALKSGYAGGRDTEAAKRIVELQPSGPESWLHVNAAAMAIAGRARHRANARGFMIYLLSDPAQAKLMAQLHLWPLRQAAASGDRPLRDPASAMAQIYRHEAAARRLLTAALWPAKEP